MAILRGYAWPGNVRELENIMERAMIVAEGNELGPEHLPHLTTPNQESSLEVEDLLPLDEMERRMILKALRRTNGHRGKTAEILGISPVSLWRKLKKYEFS